MADDYKDISEITAEAKLRRDVSIEELNNSIINLTKLINDLFVMFKTSSEQIKLEEKEREKTKNVHEDILSKLDDLMEQNKMIAAGIVSVADIVKQNKPMQDKLQMQKPQQPIPTAPLWPTDINAPQFMQRPPMPQGPPPMAPSFSRSPNMPPINPSPLNQQGIQSPTIPEPIVADMIGNVPPPEFDIPDLDEPFPFEDEKKKKGLFGRFKK